MQVVVALLLTLLVGAGVRAEHMAEATAVLLLSHKKPLWLPVNTKTTPGARALIHFWVGADGEVEAVELTCGEEALFDEVVDAVLEWEFRPMDNPHSFTTDLSFVRRGRRVWLVLDLPPAQRPRGNICATARHALLCLPQQPGMKLSLPA